MLKSYIRAIQSSEFTTKIGKVKQFFGLIVESSGPEVFVGELCEIYSRGREQSVLAEVVGIKDDRVLLMPYSPINGISVGSEVTGSGQPAQVSVGEGLLGRVIDALGKPLDDRPMTDFSQHYPLYGEPINPLRRPRIDSVLETGVKAIDGLHTIGKGQRIGIFAGSGVGKSTLLGMIARNTNADINVIALIGERGREVMDFLDQVLGTEGLKKSVVVVATSDQPALMRIHAAFTASTIAEYFRDLGYDVVLTMDSISRFAMAQRELGLAVGEPPTSRGYTPSVFALLPRVIERAGTTHNGTITAFYTVLIDGDDMREPIADSVRSIVDGHLVLSRDLANEGRYPAIDILQSKSRLMNNLVGDTELHLAKKTVKNISLYNASRDMIDIGAYQKGSNEELDNAVHFKTRIDEFLVQDSNKKYSYNESIAELSSIYQ